MQWGIGIVGLMALGACAGNQVPSSAPLEDRAKPRGFLANMLDSGDDTASATPPASITPLPQAALAGGAVIAKGPKGYCIDPTTLDAKTGGGFAIIASCNILSNGKQGDYVVPALVTVSVGARGNATNLPSAQALAEESGAPLLGGETASGFVAAQLGSGGDALLEGGDTRHWRAFFFHGDRIVRLGLFAPKGSAMARSDGGSLLRKVRDQIVAASPKPEAAVAAAQPGLLKGLFNR